MESRPEYRVAAAGLDPRDVRLIEIVFKHSQYNRYAFRFEPRLDLPGVDILIVNPLVAEGLRAVARVRSAGRPLPVVSAVPRGASSNARHALSIDRLTLQLLPILNRVVELELRGAGDDAARHAASGQRDASPAGSDEAVPGDPDTERSTRGFLREAARKSREGDSAREAALRARTAASGAPPGAAQSADASFDAAGERTAHGVGAERFAASAGARFEHRAVPSPARAREWPAETPSNLVAFPRSAEPAAPRIRVLVVDDSPTVRQQLTIAFGRMNVLCDVAPDADTALERLSSEHYDLALVDVVMPGVDGYKLTRQIRRRHRGVPVIILTSRSSPFDLARGALAGCNSYLVKPVPLRQLEAAVVKQLRKSLAIDDVSGLLRLTPDPRSVQRAPAPAPQAGEDGAGEPPRARAPGEVRR